MIYERKERWDKAEQLRIDELKQRIEVQGKKHPAVISRMVSFAHNQFEQGHIAEVERLYIQLLESSDYVLVDGGILELEENIFSAAIKRLVNKFSTAGSSKPASCELESLSLRMLELRIKISGPQANLATESLVLNELESAPEAVSLIIGSLRHCIRCGF